MSLDAARIASILERHDRAVPRYTSYPPANHFHAGVGPEAYAASLGELPAEAPLALYVHVPFCEKRCSYCGCHVIPTPRREAAGPYLSALEGELGLLAGCLAKGAGARRGLSVVHVGGGTPTFLSPAELERLFASIRLALGIEAGAELSVEVDPRVTSPEHLAVLRRLGVGRLSLGVQDACSEVQEAIGRGQSWDVTRRVYDLARGEGFESLNVDLVYGLPLQTRERFALTLRQVLELRPDRVAAFGYAHLPESRPHQRAIPAAALPGTRERIDLCADLHEAFAAAGYEHIGLDHFALPGDVLSAARRERRLARNFMGYTAWKGLAVLGAGVSAIADTGSGYFQAHKRLAPHARAIEARRLPIERGFLLEEEDVLRRRVIHDILCALEVSAPDLEPILEKPFWERFERERRELERLEADGLVDLDARGLRVRPEGRLILRVIAAAFDARLGGPRPAEGLYSRAI